jgi:hypothetical protein
MYEVTQSAPALSIHDNVRGRARDLIDRVIDQQLDDLESSLRGDVHPMVADQVSRPLDLLEQAMRLRSAL